MKIWTLTFQGLYPVGACAVVRARTERGARSRFLTTWKKENPNTSGLPAIYEVRELIEDCHIILNGDY
jgi:hypothetical protein